ADQALVLHALVLAAQAFVVLDGPEDARAEQAVALRLEGAVVDRFRLLDFAERPGVDVVRTRDRNLDAIESRDRRLGLEEVGDLVHSLSPGGRGLASHELQNGGRPPRGRRAARRSLRYSAAAGGKRGLSGSACCCSTAAVSDPRSSTLRPRARISL